MHRSLIRSIIGLTFIYCAPTWPADGNLDSPEVVPANGSTERRSRSRDEMEATHTDGLGYWRGRNSGRDEWFEPPRFNRESERGASSGVAPPNDHSASPPAAGANGVKRNDNASGNGQGRGIVNGLGGAVGNGVGQGIVNGAGGSFGGGAYSGGNTASSGSVSSSVGTVGAAIPSAGAGVVTGAGSVISNTTNATRGVVNSAGGLVTAR